MVRADGAYGDHEAETLSELAGELGPDQFWNLIDRAGEKFQNADEVRAAAGAIAGQETRELMYGVLLQLGRSGALLGAEPELLDWLVKTWELVPAQGPPYR